MSITLLYTIHGTTGTIPNAKIRDIDLPLGNTQDFTQGVGGWGGGWDLSLPPRILKKS